MPIWKNMIVKIGGKNVAGCVVKRLNAAVMIVDSVSKFQRGSRHCAEPADMLGDCLNAIPIGKLLPYATLLMPLLEVAEKLAFSPTSETTPHPPRLLVIAPAWIAAPQMNESPRYIRAPPSSASSPPPTTSGRYVIEVLPIGFGFRTCTL